MSDDFFDVDDTRDEEGRPRLIPRGMDPDSTPRVTYDRASSMSDYLLDTAHIQRWRMRYLARSLGMNEDLAALAGAEVYTTGFAKGDEGENRASGRRLDKIIDRALDRVRIVERADYGTVVHAATEPDFAGYAPERAKADVASFWTFVRENGIKLLATEMFTANDEVRSAGTFDHLAYVPGMGIVVTDKKTGNTDANAFAVQLAIYANADLYDITTDQRTSLEDFVSGQVNRDVGVVFQIRDGQTKAYEVDLVGGWEAARLAAAVRDYRTRGDLLAPITDWDRRLRNERKRIEQEILGLSGDRAALDRLWQEHRDIWDLSLTNAAKKALA